MQLIKKISLVLLGLAVLVLGWLLTRPGMEDIGIPYATPATEIGTNLTVKWFGISTLLIDDGETQIMTDGFFSRPSLFDLALKRPIAPEKNTIKDIIKAHKINRLAAIMPVHSHYDHAMDSGEVAKQTGAILMGSKSTAMAGRSSNLPEEKIHIVETGRTYPFGKFKITFLESKHAPLPSNDAIDGEIEEVFDLPTPYTTWKLGKVYTILIDHPKGSMLVQGSAGYIPGALKNVNVDVVFLGTGGLKRQTKEYQETYIFETVTHTNPDTVYTIHHDNMFGPLGDIEQNILMLEYNELRAFELSQLILPAQFKQMRFAEPIEIKTKVR